MIELGIVGPDRSAVRTKDGGVLLAQDVVEGFVEVAGDDRAVLALEMDVLAVRELKLTHEGIVGVRDLREFSLGGGRGKCEELVGAVDGGDLGDEVTGGSKRVIVDHEAAADGAGDLAAGDGDAADVLRAVVVGHEIDGFAVGRKTRGDTHTVERESKNFGFAANGGRDGDVLRSVVEEL